MKEPLKRFEELASSLDLDFELKKSNVSKPDHSRFLDTAIAKSRHDERSLILKPEADIYGEGYSLYLKTALEKEGYEIGLLELIYTRLVEGRDISVEDIMPDFDIETGKSYPPKVELSQGWEGIFDFIRKHWDMWLKDETSYINEYQKLNILYFDLSN